MIDQSETLSQQQSDRIYLLHSFVCRQVHTVGYILLCRCAHRWCCCCALYQPPPQTVKTRLIQNDSPELNQHVLTFLHPILLSRITYGREEQHRWRCSFRTTDTYKREICTSDHLSGAEKNPKGNSEYQKAQLCVCVLSSSGFKAFQALSLSSGFRVQGLNLTNSLSTIFMIIIIIIIWLFEINNLKHHSSFMSPNGAKYGYLAKKNLF